MKFYRYQNTNKQESVSYYVDLSNLYEDYLTSDKGELALMRLYHKYLPSLQLRDVDTEELFKQVISCETYDEVESLQEQYKVQGLFGWNAIELDEEYTLEQLLDSVNDLNYTDDREYLVLYEGDSLLNEGDLGIIFKPYKVITYWERHLSQN